MRTELKQIRSMAQSNPELVFTSLFHLAVDEEHLRACYDQLKGNKAVGVDHQTKGDYGEHLEENLRDLRDRLMRGGYKPKPARRTWIEKPGSTERRPLAVSCFEDKIVQLALREVLEAVFEPSFLPCSYGYREGRSAHGCLDELGRCIQKRKVGHVLEADIRKFFDRMNHDWLVKFVKHRISDPRVSRLLIRLLRSGIMEEGLSSTNEEGAPQGSILSPLLSNIYLHYVLDLWFTRRISRKLRGEAYLYRYADDFVLCFQYAEDAARVQGELVERMAAFNLELAEEKTRRVAFGRYAADEARRGGRKPGSFVFLGFRFVMGKTRKGYFKVKRQTAGKRLSRCLKELKAWLGMYYARMRKGELIRSVIRKVSGHLEYFAITDNFQACGTFVYHARRLLFRALNRKSQRKAYTWAGYWDALRQAKWPRTCLKHKIDPCRKVWEQGAFKSFA